MGDHSVTLPESFTLCDAVVGSWIRPRIDGSEVGRVKAVAPTGFESYIRVLHPACDPEGRQVRWEEVCRLTGQPAGPLMQWAHISDPVNWTESSDHNTVLALISEEPLVGTLDRTSYEDLIEKLLDEAEGREPRCYFALWSGWAWLSESMKSRSRLHFPLRDYFVYTSMLSTVPEFGSQLIYSQSPNLIWPEGHAWIIATEIDFDSTIIGGSDDLCRSVLGSERFESWRVSGDDLLALR